MQAIGGIVEGTLIKTLDGLKPIETVDYSDILYTWHFNGRELSSATPFWIQIAQIADKYYLLEFSNGSQLKLIEGQLLFNKLAGAFTDIANETETPIGTITYTADGEDIILLNRTLIQESIKYYNILSIYFMNIFVNNILLSCKYSNMYPIEDMKYIIEPRPIIPYSDYGDDFPYEYYDNLHLGEQLIPIEENKLYVKELEGLKS